MEDLLLALVFMIAAFSATFVFCELGQRLTSQFDEINYELYQCEWYMFPLNIKKILPLIMNGTQQPVTLRGYGNVQCTHEALKNVRCPKI